CARRGKNLYAGYYGPPYYAMDYW
nr:immunoglobulin heavy chain junction region [Mus musculus]MBK4186481.1 immunoglobulin heavy chain junction region [Mus musculus]